MYCASLFEWLSSRRQYIPKKQCLLEQLFPTSYLCYAVVALPREKHGSHFCTHPLPDGNDWWQMTLTKDVPTLCKYQVLDRLVAKLSHPLLRTFFNQTELSLESTRMMSVLWTLVLRLPHAVVLEKTHGKNSEIQRLKESAHCKGTQRSGSRLAILFMFVL